MYVGDWCLWDDGVIGVGVYMSCFGDEFVVDVGDFFDVFEWIFVDVCFEFVEVGVLVVYEFFVVEFFVEDYFELVEVYCCVGVGV